MSTTVNSSRQWGLLVLVGLVTGLFSGMFGIGGGLIIVPALTMIVGFDQKLASGTSLATIIPLSLVGVASYAAQGNVSLWGAIFIAAGSIFGTAIGTWLLDKLPVPHLQIIFSLFMIVAIVSLFLVVPSRDATLTIDVWQSIFLVILGVVVGVLSGLLGIGGGAIVVPTLMLLFGVSDLVAKGTSLLMMLPTSVFGTWKNFRHQHVDIRAALIVGIPACFTTTVGTWLANLLPPLVANILFAIFLVFIGGRMFLKAIRTLNKKQS